MIFYGFDQQIDFGAWKTYRYGYLLGLQRWDPENIGKRCHHFDHLGT